tara:strand:- start:16002 stop:17420 length:1419 start_codon:yes stop_codon:yes gene_type:complete
MIFYAEDVIKNIAQKMNLRILVYLNPSNIDKITHEFNLEGDSGFIMVKNTIMALNKIQNWHYYLLVPNVHCWNDRPENVTLIEYPYINDALNSRFHFDTNAINKYFNVYRHDIDLIWSMLPELVSNLKAFANKRREEIPIFTYINWMDWGKKSLYQPGYALRMYEGILEADMVGIQSRHMANEMKKILSEFTLPENKIHIIPPKTEYPCQDDIHIGDLIGFPHRISLESGFKEMYSLIKDRLKYKLWVTNLNNTPFKAADMVINKFYSEREEYIKTLKKLRFGISYHIKYSMWSMSVLDMMAQGKCVLVPKKNAFPEMFGDNYPFYFNNKKEFVKKFELLQSLDDEQLLAWGHTLKARVRAIYSWDTHAKQISGLFVNSIAIRKSKKSEEIASIIKNYNAITKGDLINKALTSFGRRCSRAWNKCRMDLMVNYGIKDDINNEHTIFYSDKDRYINNGIEKRGGQERQLTIYE